MNPHPFVRCRQALAVNASTDPLDVLKIKSMLHSLGHYDIPDWGMSPYPDSALFGAIMAFQESQGLKSDGVIKPNGETEGVLSHVLTPHHVRTAVYNTAQALQALGRGRDEILAHITPEEAVLLHRVTDGMSINPETGLMEFEPDDGAFNDAVNDAYDSGMSDNDFFDAFDAFSSAFDAYNSDGIEGNETDFSSGYQSGDAASNGQKSPQKNGNPEKHGNSNGQKQGGVNSPQSRSGWNSFDPDEGRETLGEDGLLADEEEDNPPGYNPDETIEDVEAQFAAAFGAKNNQPNGVDPRTSAKVVQKTLENYAKNLASKSGRRTSAPPTRGLGGVVNIGTKNPYDFLYQGNQLMNSVPHRDSYLRTGEKNSPDGRGGGSVLDLKTGQNPIHDLLY